MRKIWLVGILVIFDLIILGMILIYNISAKNSEYKKSSEYNCLKNIAKSFCEKRNMEFVKVYIPLGRIFWSSEDFACDNIGNSYAFTEEEEKRCK